MSPIQSPVKISLTVLTFALAIALSACGKDQAAGAQGGGKAAAGGMGAMPPTEVLVVVAQSEPIEQSVELSGRTSAFQLAEVRPQVSGIIQKRLFVEGSYVHEGQPLYQLESNTYQVAVTSAQAVVNKARANLAALLVKQHRYQQLVAINAISKQEYDDITAQVALAQADVATAQSQLAAANISLGYAVIRAPISGQTGRSTLTAGALVTANQATPLVTIQQLDPIYVDISQSSADMLRLRQQLAAGTVQSNASGARIKLVLEDGTPYPQEGRLAVAGASVDQASGAVILRAVVPNPQGILLPGMYVKAQLPQGINNKAMLIPQQAVSRTPKGEATVLVVDQSGTVASKTIQIARAQGDQWVVTSGLDNGDRVIVEGTMKAKPGSQVKVVLADKKADSAAGTEPAPAATSPAGPKAQA